jgi:hypothetical protein
MRSSKIIVTFAAGLAAVLSQFVYDEARAGADTSRRGSSDGRPPQTQSAGRHNPAVVPVHARPLGRSYSQWSAAWLQWVFQMPATGHPLLPGGVQCNERQSGKVWFLGGALFSANPVSRSCVVPAGTSLFFPMIQQGYGAFLNDPPEQRTEDFLRQAVECTDPVIAVAIDGVAIRNPTQYLVRSALVDIQLSTDNLFGLDETTVPQLKLSPSVDFGYYLFLAPLPVGVHDISWSAKMNCPISGGEVSQTVNYHVSVTPRPRFPSP